MYFSPRRECFLENQGGKIEARPTSLLILEEGQNFSFN